MSEPREPEADPDGLADDLEHRADELQQRSGELEEKIEQTGRAWSAKRSDSSEAGALPPDGDFADAPRNRDEDDEG